MNTTTNTNSRTYIGSLAEHKNTEVTIKGWIHVRRDQGKLVFFEFRDKTGLVQGVVLPGVSEELKETVKSLRDEWVVEVKGKVNPRPERNIQADKQNGDIELEILDIQVLNSADTPPYDLHSDTREINEETRLKYRYLDLRNARLAKNIRARHKITKLVRDALDNEGFTEIETPLLTKSTPEGARDFIVPSRLDVGAFYALPQSPQQYKQLLMTAGFEKYFQFAKCMRDEDTRGDRQPEFTQLDMEMSFVEQEDVMSLTEKLLIDVVTKLYPHKRIQQIPFQRITYKDAMEQYGIDRPDIREDKEDPNLLAFCWVIDFPFFEKDEKRTITGADGLPQAGWTFTHNPFSAAQPAHREKLAQSVPTDKDLETILAAQYDIVLNGFEIGGGSVRNHQPESLLKVFEILGYSKENVEQNFSHMLHAFKSGTPPHGGIAWGFDRLVMLLENEPNIREVIPFPKTGEGRDPMMISPSAVSKEQLTELHIQVQK
jgi:aspartyl-tRNA synthetase